MSRPKVVFLTGAGVSRESGISTFRDLKDGLWYNFKVDEVATIEAWEKDKEKVLDFYNQRRKGLDEVSPNLAHLTIADMETMGFDVTIVTQNVDDLHERANSSNVLHLHGELSKARSDVDREALVDCLEDIKVGDLHQDGSQLRPHLVLFGEYPYNVDEAYTAIYNCDYLIVVGTTGFISYIPDLIRQARKKVYYIDPEPSVFLPHLSEDQLTIIKEPATVGVKLVAQQIQNIEFPA